MGIPSYFSWIIKNHLNIIQKYNSQFPIHNLYLDCNSIIYDAIQKIDFSLEINNKCKDETTSDIIISAICNKIDEYIYCLSPKQNVYIAFDGVAPVAKLNQQRARRYKSTYQNNLSRSILKKTDVDPWNTTAITPGTKFMAALNQKIYNKYSDPSVYNIINIIVSGSDEPGEGEHKLFEYIRNFPEEHKDKNTVIYGLDADLIMLSMNHLSITKNIYLFRETPHFIQSLNADLEPNELYMLDIPELSKAIMIDMNNEDCIHDYILLCFFLGNDFLPHFPALNIRTGGIEKLINAYKAIIGEPKIHLTDGEKIYWKNVNKMLQFIATNEEIYFKEETKQRDRRERFKKEATTPEEKLKQIETIPIYEREIEKYINPYKSNWQPRYYKALFNTNIDDIKRKEICMNYLEGLEWTMKYYTTGCPHWRWTYKYHYPPLLCDLVKYIPFNNKELMPKTHHLPVKELVQLCYVTPKQSLDLLPIDLYNKLIKEKLKWYKTDSSFLWAYCRYFWESHVDLPEIDIDELERFLSEVP